MKRVKKPGFLKVFENRGENADRPLLDDNKSDDGSIPRVRNEPANDQEQAPPREKTFEKPHTPNYEKKMKAVDNSSHIGELKIKPQPGLQKSPAQAPKSKGFLKGVAKGIKSNITNTLMRNDATRLDHSENTDRHDDAEEVAEAAVEPVISDEAGYAQIIIGEKKAEVTEALPEESEAPLTQLKRATTVPVHVERSSTPTRDSDHSNTPKSTVKRKTRVRVRASQAAALGQPLTPGKRIAVKRRVKNQTSEGENSDKDVGRLSDHLTGRAAPSIETGTLDGFDDEKLRKGSKRPQHRRSLSDNSMMPKKSDEEEEGGREKSNVKTLVDEFKRENRQKAIQQDVGPESPGRGPSKTADALLSPRRLMKKIASDRNVFGSPFGKKSRFNTLNMSGDLSLEDFNPDTLRRTVSQDMNREASSSLAAIESDHMKATHHRANGHHAHGQHAHRHQKHDALRSTVHTTSAPDVFEILDKKKQSESLDRHTRSSMHTPTTPRRSHDELRSTVHTSAVSKTPIGRKLVSEIVKARREPPIRTNSNGSQRRASTGNGDVLPPGARSLERRNSSGGTDSPQPRRKPLEVRRARTARKSTDASGESQPTPKTPSTSGHPKVSQASSPKTPLPSDHQDNIPSTPKSSKSSPNSSGHAASKSPRSSKNRLPNVPISPGMKKNKHRSSRAAAAPTPTEFTWQRSPSRSPMTRRMSNGAIRRVEQPIISKTLAQMYSGTDQVASQPEKIKPVLDIEAEDKVTEDTSGGVEQPKEEKSNDLADLLTLDETKQDEDDESFEGDESILSSLETSGVISFHPRVPKAPEPETFPPLQEHAEEEEADEEKDAEEIDEHGLQTADGNTILEDEHAILVEQDSNDDLNPDDLDLHDELEQAKQELKEALSVVERLRRHVKSLEEQIQAAG